jgi:hypothetical protein
VLVSKGKPGDFRPIGVGECVAVVAKRVTNTVLMEATNARLLETGQWQGSRRACSRMAAVVDRLMREGGYACCSLDARNAFNSMERGVVDEELVGLVTGGNEAAAAVVGIVQMCFQPTHMSCGEWSKIVRRGVVQGDPMSATLFALGMSGIAGKLRDHYEGSETSVSFLRAGEEPTAEALRADILVAWYADDLVVLWKEVRHLKDFARVAGGLYNAAGLEMRADKSQTLLPRGVRTVDVADPADEQAEARGDTRSRVEGIPIVPALKVVGGALGQPAAARLLVKERILSAAQKLADVRRLERPMIDAMVLRVAGLACRVDWALESSPTGIIDEEVMRFACQQEDDLVRGMLGEYGEADWGGVMEMARLPVGGPGLDDLRARGRLQDGRWVRWSDAEKVEVRNERMDGLKDLAVRHGRPDIIRRIAEAESVVVRPGTRIAANAWMHTPVALAVKVKRTVVDRKRVEALALALSVGTDPRLVGAGERKCQGNHSGQAGKNGVPLAFKHMLDCKSLVTNQRHHASRDQLLSELRAIPGTAGTVKEAGLDATGKYTLGRTGDVKVFGDVAWVHQGKRSFLDVTWLSTTTTSYGLGDKHRTKVSGWNNFPCKGETDKFHALAISASGVICEESIVGLPFLSKAALCRTVAAGLLRQAEGIVQMLDADKRLARCLSSTRAIERSAEHEWRQVIGQEGSLGRSPSMRSDTGGPRVRSRMDRGGSEADEGPPPGATRREGPTMGGAGAVGVKEAFNGWVAAGDDTAAAEWLESLNRSVRGWEQNDITAALDLQVQATGGAGDCLYKGLAISVDGSERGWQEVREMAAGEVGGLDRAERETVGLGGDDAWGEQVRRLRTVGVCGEVAEATWAARGLDVSLLVVTDDTAGSPCVICPYRASADETSGLAGAVAFLRFRNGHYSGAWRGGAHPCGRGPLSNVFIPRAAGVAGCVTSAGRGVTTEAGAEARARDEPGVGRGTSRRGRSSRAGAGCASAARGTEGGAVGGAGVKSQGTGGRQGADGKGGLQTRPTATGGRGGRGGRGRGGGRRDQGRDSAAQGPT